MSLQQVLDNIKQECINITQSEEKVCIFVSVQRKTIFGDTSEVIIMLYAKACVNQETQEVNLGCELKTSPIF